MHESSQSLVTMVIMLCIYVIMYELDDNTYRDVIDYMYIFISGAVLMIEGLKNSPFYFNDVVV